MTLVLLYSSYNCAVRIVLGAGNRGMFIIAGRQPPTPPREPLVCQASSLSLASSRRCLLAKRILWIRIKASVCCARSGALQLPFPFPFSSLVLSPSFSFPFVPFPFISLPFLFSCSFPFLFISLPFPLPFRSLLFPFRSFPLPALPFPLPSEALCWQVESDEVRL